MKQLLVQGRRSGRGSDFLEGAGVAASLTGDTASNIAPGVDANKLTYLGGPRYTYTVWKGHAGASDQRRLKSSRRARRGARLRRADYPASPAPVASANSFAFQAAAEMPLSTRSFGIRLLEADYVRTALPSTAPTHRTTCAWHSESHTGLHGWWNKR